MDIYDKIYNVQLNISSNINNKITEFNNSDKIIKWSNNKNKKLNNLIEELLNLVEKIEDTNSNSDVDTDL